MAAFFTDYILKHIFLNENIRISIQFSLKFVPKGPIDNIPALVQIMAWHRIGAKPLSEPMHICGTRGRWVKGWTVSNSIINCNLIEYDINRSYFKTDYVLSCLSYNPCHFGIIKIMNQHQFINNRTQMYSYVICDICWMWHATVQWYQWKQICIKLSICSIWMWKWQFRLTRSFQ